MKKKIALLLSALLMLSLVGCGGAATNMGYISDEVSQGAGFTGGFNSSPSDDYYSDIEEMAPSESAPQDAPSKDQEEQEQIKSQDKLVYTCNMSIETLDYQNTLKAIKDKITEFNGIIEYEEQTDSAHNWYYSDYEKTRGTLQLYMTIRIPSEKYEEFLNSIEGSGKVTQKSTNVENISKTYYETEATIEALEIQEDRLLDMLKTASTIEDMIAVEARLTEVQTELNRYKTSLESMNMDVNYSTINLNVKEVLEYSIDNPGQKTNTFFDRLKNTIKASWEGFLDLLEGILFAIIRLFPIALVVCVIAIPVVKFIKKHRKPKKDKKVLPTETPKEKTLDTTKEDENK